MAYSLCVLCSHRIDLCIFMKSISESLKLLGETFNLILVVFHYLFFVCNYKHYTTHKYIHFKE